MTNDITLSELQQFIAGFWYLYDEAHYDELGATYADDVHYVTRSDSGASPFEDLMSPELNGRDAVMAWLTEHRQQSPYPLRHHATNVHRTGGDGLITKARFYILVNQIADFVPFAVSSGVVDVGVRRHGSGLVFTDMEVVLDTQNSVPLAELTADTATRS